MWLEAFPRRRLAIPSRDLGIGIAVGVALCVVAGVMAATMSSATPPAPPEPLTVSIGVLAAPPTPSGGEPGRVGKPGKKGGRSESSDDPSESETEPEPRPTPSRSSSSSSSSKRLPVNVPNPHQRRELPGLGELGDPRENGDGEEGDGGTPGAEGSGKGGAGGGDGGVGAYRARLAAWLSPHFHVERSGLGAKALRALRVHAVLELSEDRVVLGYQLRSTGKSVIDDAARRALEAVKGTTAPAPPPSVGSLTRLKVVLVCGPDTCN